MHSWTKRHERGAYASRTRDRVAAYDCSGEEAGDTA
jgi:hypothetical protein